MTLTARATCLMSPTPSKNRMALGSRFQYRRNDAAPSPVTWRFCSGKLPPDNCSLISTSHVRCWAFDVGCWTFASLQNLRISAENSNLILPPSLPPFLR